jgi:hypothetical protein
MNSKISTGSFVKQFGTMSPTPTVVSLAEHCLGGSCMFSLACLDLFPLLCVADTSSRELFRCRIISGIVHGFLGVRSTVSLA